MTMAASTSSNMMTVAFLEERLISSEAVNPAKALARLRRDFLLDGSDGFAAHFLPLLKQMVQSWCCSVRNSVKNNNNKSQEDGDVQDEKKDDRAADVHYHQVHDSPETKLLHRVLHLDLLIHKSDPTLAEELAHQGETALLTKLLQQVDATLFPSFSLDFDAISHIQDVACEIMIKGGSNNKNISPYTVSELQARLPLELTFPSGEKDVDELLSVWLRQVPNRQSAQRDVGFVLWPSAVALSHLLLSNDEITNLLQSQITILELGAGCGLVGLAVAAMAQNRKHDTKVIMTDFNPTVIENLNLNLQLNNLDEQQHQAMGLDFTHQSGCSSNGWLDMNGDRQESVDLILGADVICQPSDAIAAAKTIHDALKVDGGRALLISASGEHRFGIDVLETSLKQVGLTVQVSAVPNVENIPFMEQTAGFVSGMKLNLFDITKTKNNQSTNVTPRN